MKKVMMILILMTFSIDAVSEGWAVCRTPTGGAVFCRSSAPPVLAPQPVPQMAPQPVPVPQPLAMAGTALSAQPPWCNNGRPQNQTESVICGTQSLWHWDIAYNAVWNAWDTATRGPKPNGKGALKDRDQYTSPDQIAAWYQSAIGQLNSGSPPVAQQQAAPAVALATTSSGGDGNGGVIKWCSGKKKLNEAEQTLCKLAKDAPVLASLEGQINDAYKAYKKKNANQRELEVQKQRAWLERRDEFLLSLSTVQVNPQIAATQLTQFYQRRIAELKQP